MLHYNTHILYKYGTILSFVTYPMNDIVPVDLNAVSLQALKESICGMLKSILLPSLVVGGLLSSLSYMHA